MSNTDESQLRNQENANNSGAITGPRPDSDYDNLQFVDSTEPETDEGDGCSEVTESIAWAATSPGSLPFSFLHKPAEPFKSQERNVYIPGKGIVVKVIDVERSFTGHMLNPNLYVIQVQHGDFQWIVKKRYKHFNHLHQQLQIFRTALKIPFPTKAHKDKRKSMVTQMKSDERAGNKNRTIPRFPKKPDTLLTADQLEHRSQQLEEYLKNLLKSTMFRNHPETLEFLEISNLSFVGSLGGKGKEGLVKKRTGDLSGPVTYRFLPVLKNCCGGCLASWRRRWLVVKDTYLLYIRPADGRIKCVMLMDQGFEVSRGIYGTGSQSGVIIINKSRVLVLKAWTRRKAKEWVDFIDSVAKSSGKDFIGSNRFGSFAPIRSSIEASWFVDGASYMEAVAEAINNAKEEIFIADWWLSPEIYLKRPRTDGDEWRLDLLLLKKAREGVKVFIMLYKEVELALGINSLYSKQKLMDKHNDNIKIFRHPDHVNTGVLLWAHHEKIVVVDQCQAFLGGIDLCYGRWDDPYHRLTDLGEVTHNNNNDSLFKPPQQFLTSSYPSDNPLIPQSLMVLAQAAHTFSFDTDSTRQSINSTNSSKRRSRRKRKTRRRSTGIEPNEDGNDPAEAKEDESSGKLMSKIRTLKAMGQEWKDDVKEWGDRQLKKFHEEGSSEEEDNGQYDNLGMDDNPVAMTNISKSKYWLGKDYANFIVKDFIELDKPFEDSVDRNTTPRMPWHDIGLMVTGAAALDVARHFIQRWNAIKVEKAKNNKRYTFLIPKAYSIDNAAPVKTSPTHFVNCQVLRSISTWSGGLQDAEESIHHAYIDIIQKAKHFVYIENQFFVSPGSGCLDVRNGLGNALFNRIMKAFKEGSRFRVIVVMPLLPGFEGQVGTNRGTAMQAITHWNYASISRGDHSLIQRLLKEEVPDPSQYVTFYGLRKYTELHKRLVSELVYVHSKLMIVDDIKVVCGSANINDRSLTGVRDSEIAALIEDTEFEDSVMDGKHYRSGKFAGSLRRFLFKEHLGLLDNSSSTIDVTDPVSDHFYKDTWVATAAKNTTIFDKVFHCIPTDSVLTFAQLREYLQVVPLSMADPSLAQKQVQKIQGQIVLLPLQFLAKENLTPSTGTKEALLPTSVWL